MPTNLELVRTSNKATQDAVLPNSSASGPTANDQSVAKAAQSIGQTTAIVIQDAADMLRNISTIETTAIGAATAAWLATEDPIYETIIQSSMTVMQDAAALYLTIGQNAYTVLTQFKTQG
jgi:hypothetical protein